jgi:hypothetical protein
MALGGGAGLGYGMYFYDVTTGNNQADPSIPGYPATTGWDPVTGLGTPKRGSPGARAGPAIPNAIRTLTVSYAPTNTEKPRSQPDQIGGTARCISSLGVAVADVTEPS